MQFQELIDLEDERTDPFIQPVIQGFAELRKAQLKLFDSPQQQQQQVDGGAEKKAEDKDRRLPEFYTVALISRRCRHRAGTRYNRRGVDEEG